MSRRRVALSTLVVGLVAGIAFGLVFAESPTAASDCSLDRDDASIAWHLERYATGCGANGDRFDSARRSELDPEQRSESDPERASDLDPRDTERVGAQTSMP